MAGTIHEVLFRLVGDEDDARKSLETITAELEAFNSIEATAEADLDTKGALIRLEELEGALDKLDERTASPRISADIGAVMLQLEALRAELKKIDDEDVEVDVDRRNQLLGRIAALSKQATLLGRASSKATGDFKSFGSRIADTAVNFGPFTTQVRTAVPLVGALAGVVVALGGALVAMASSLAAAVGGIAALGVALGGVAGAGIFTLIVAIQRFQEQSKKPGTPANDLLKAWQEIGNVIKQLGPLVDPIFTALAEGARAAAGLLRGLGPALASFAKDAANSLGPFVALLKDPGFRASISAVISLAGDTLRPLVRIGTAIFQIFTNIARAAMPFLTQALRDAAGWLGKIANATSDVNATTGVIAVLVRNLRLWVSLLSALVGLIAGVFRAALPAGEEFVGWLRDLVKSWSDWANSAEGQDRLKKFFEDVVPLAKSVLETVARIILAFIQLGEFAAPILKPIVDGFNAALTALNWLLEKLNIAGGALKQLVGFIALLFSPLARVRFVVAAVLFLFGDLGHIAVEAFNKVRKIAGSVGGFLANLFHKVGAIAAAMWKSLPQIASAIWGRVKAIIGGILHGISAVIHAVWDAIVSYERTVWGTVATIIEGVWNGIKRFVTGIVHTIRDVITGAWNAVKNGTSAAFHAVVGAIEGAFTTIWDFIAGIPDRMYQFGRDIVTGIADGIKSLPGIVGDALKDAVLAPVHAIGGALGINSPSKVTMEFGKGVGEGFDLGIRKMLGTVSRSANALAAAALPSFGAVGAGLAGHAAGAGASSSSKTINNTIPVTVAGGGGHPDARALVADIDRELRQRGLSIA